MLRRRGQPGRRRASRHRRATRWAASGAGRGRRTGASSTTAPRPTRTASRGASARGWSGGTPSTGTWTGDDVPDFPLDHAAGLRAAARRRRPMAADRRAATRSSCRPTARRGCSRPAACATGRCRRTTSRRSRRSATGCTASRPTRRARSGTAPDNPYHLAFDDPPVPGGPVDQPADRAPQRGGDEPLAAVPGRAAAGAVRRDVARSWPPSAGWSNGDWVDDRARPGPRSTAGCW